MAKTRDKKVIPTSPIKREEAEALFAEYAYADARQQQMTAKMDGEITKIREKYQDDLQAYVDTKQEKFDMLQYYAQQNPESFVKRKSIEFQHGLIGFRTGTPKLKTMKGFTWASVLKLMKEFMAGYIRIEEAPNKELIIADRESPEVKSLMNKCGLLVDQDETFFVEPKKEIVA